MILIAKTMFRADRSHIFSYLPYHGLYVLLPKLKNAKRTMRYKWKSWRAQINESPIIILGNQKSGTSAIASIFAKATGLSATIDLKREIQSPSLPQVASGEMAVDAFVQRNRLEFSRSIIKEPHLTPFYKQLRAAFPNARFVFVVRDPRDNIRSILDRLQVSGHQEHLTARQWERLNPSWRLVLDGRWLGLQGRDYIEMLSARWNLCVSTYFANSSEMILFTYEDFLKNKLVAIQELAKELQENVLIDVRDDINVQYQRAGANRGRSWTSFFGNNLTRIVTMCRDNMKKLGYELEDSFKTRK